MDEFSRENKYSDSLSDSDDDIVVPDANAFSNNKKQSKKSKNRTESPKKIKNRKSFTGDESEGTKKLKSRKSFIGDESDGMKKSKSKGVLNVKRKLSSGKKVKHEKRKVSEKSTIVIQKYFRMYLIASSSSPLRLDVDVTDILVSKDVTLVPKIIRKPRGAPGSRALPSRGHHSNVVSLPQSVPDPVANSDSPKNRNRTGSSMPMIGGYGIPLPDVKNTPIKKEGTQTEESDEKNEVLLTPKGKKKGKSKDKKSKTPKQSKKSKTPKLSKKPKKEKKSKTPKLKKKDKKKKKYEEYVVEKEIEDPSQYKSVLKNFGTAPRKRKQVKENVDFRSVLKHNSPPTVEKTEEIEQQGGVFDFRAVLKNRRENTESEVEKRDEPTPAEEGPYNFRSVLKKRTEVPSTEETPKEEPQNGVFDFRSVLKKRN
eukprot:TRINITY_DN335_c0_g2_i7.p1 TRINITY_DN335_c0_g2~~TRINITY_DN335_c0_g2_i7.p1  ORF type:complete len:425 (-),score=127.21 TRINITY_DN335_c0_g2_i7:1287-2561(-)